MSAPQRQSVSAAQVFHLLWVMLAIGTLAQAEDFNTRRAAFLNYYQTAVPNLDQCCSGPHRIGRTGFWAAQGRFLNNDLLNGSNFLSAALGDVDAEGADAGFSMWPAMDCYLRWNTLSAVFTPAITSQFQAQLTVNGTNYASGATANQRMMLAATRYLAGTVWGTSAFPAGAQFQADYGTGDPTGKTYVSNTIATIPLYGLLEHDSLIYGQYTLGPVYTLSQFAPDPALRNQARLAFDWAVAGMAGYYFFDNWATASDRTEPYWVQTQPTATTLMSYLLFGGPSPATYLEAYPSALYCMSNFPGVPPELVTAATTRTQPYTHYSTAMRNTGGCNNAYFKTCYLTPTYSLYSQVECAVATNSDGSFVITNYGTTSLSDPHQMQRWGIIWNAPNDQTKFWITNPYNPVYSGSYPNTYIGTTIAEDTVQLGGTLVAVYNIPTNTTKPDWNHNGAAMANYQLLEGQIPTNYSAVIDESGTSGRLFLHYTNVLIALYLSTNFTWCAATTLTNYFLVPANVAGLAVETACPGEYAQATAAARLAAFRTDVLTCGSANTNLLTGAHPAMLYTDRHGNTLQVAFGQGAKTNGQCVDYQQWPTLRNPWLYQPQLGNLFIFGTNRTLIYNFNTWTETTNNQPVLLSSAAATTTRNQFVDIDLGARVSDVETPTGSLLFTVGSPTNGTVALLADGHTARFSPSTNYNGPAAFGFTATDYGLDPRLVLYYQPPSTLSDNLIADVSGNARNATLVVVGASAAGYDPSTPTALSRFIPQSLRLTQTNNGAAAVALSRTVTPGNLSMTNASWTFATWFKRATQTNDNFIFYIGNSKGFSGSGDVLQLYGNANTNTVAVRHYNTSGALDLDLASPGLGPAGQWHHVALVFQHVADNTNTLTLYLDAVPVATASNVTWALRQDLPLVFGGHNSTSAKVYRWFNGSLAELALFRGALTPGEIVRLLTGTVKHLGGFTLSNSVPLIIALPPNAAPGLSPIPNTNLNAGATLCLNLSNYASDPDLPLQSLTFGLAAGPTNAALATNSGILSWRPTVAQAATTNLFTVTATDNGSPSLSATQSFTVLVNPLVAPAVSALRLANRTMQLCSSGALGPDYTVQASTDLVVWTSLFITNSPAPPFSWTDTNSPAFSQRFYRLLLGP